MAANFHLLASQRDWLQTTNAEVAEKVGRSKGSIENVMCGADQPSRKLTYLLADALQLEADEIAPDIRAGKRTPRGDPSEPPQQPKGPKGPPKKGDKEKDNEGPKRAEAVA